MTAALLVNPFDGEEVASALHQAREMPLEERRNRHADLMRCLREYDVKRWRDEFVAALAATPARRPGTGAAAGAA
jgi:trehalose 6-phosphate synthase